MKRFLITIVTIFLTILAMGSIYSSSTNIDFYIHISEINSNTLDQINIIDQREVHEIKYELFDEEQIPGNLFSINTRGVVTNQNFFITYGSAYYYNITESGYLSLIYTKMLDNKIVFVSDQIYVDIEQDTVFDNLYNISITLPDINYYNTSILHHDIDYYAQPVLKNVYYNQSQLYLPYSQIFENKIIFNDGIILIRDGYGLRIFNGYAITNDIINVDFFYTYAYVYNSSNLISESITLEYIPINFDLDINSVNHFISSSDTNFVYIENIFMYSLIIFPIISHRRCFYNE